MAIVGACGLLASGCAHGGATSKSKVPTAQRDPTAALITKADSHLDLGVAEVRKGHLNRARQEFDLALNVYLGAPGGALASPRLAQAYRRTLQAIQLHELEALAAGDGFTEEPAEDAAI